MNNGGMISSRTFLVDLSTIKQSNCGKRNFADIVIPSATYPIATIIGLLRYRTFQIKLENKKGRKESLEKKDLTNELHEDITEVSTTLLLSPKITLTLIKFKTANYASKEHCSRISGSLR